MRQTQFTNSVLSANGQKLEIRTEGLSTLGIQVVGAMSATIQVEGTIDGRNWFALNSVPVSTNTPVTSITGATVLFSNISGLIAARLRCSSYTSGTPTMALVAIEEGLPERSGTFGPSSVTLTTALQALVAGVETDSILAMPARRSDAFLAIYNSADASTAASVKAATAAKSIYITDVVVSVGSAMNVTLQDNAGTPVVAVQPLYLPANSVWSKTFSTPIKLATNVALMVKASTTGNISVTVTGYLI